MTNRTHPRRHHRHRQTLQLPLWPAGQSPLRRCQTRRRLGPQPRKRLTSLGEELGVPGYTDLDRMVLETAPQVGIVSVNYGANGEVGRMAVEAGLQRPARDAHRPQTFEADAIIAAAQQRGLKIEVAEQFHRRPLEQIKLKLLASGLFGKVYASFNDFAGHGYHGVSVMRSYLGFDARPLRVTGSRPRLRPGRALVAPGKHLRPAQGDPGARPDRI